MIQIFIVVQNPIDDKFRVTEEGDEKGTAYGGVHDTPTKAFLCGLKFLKKNCKKPFVIKYLGER